jgi:hypothetical protein
VDVGVGDCGSELEPDRKRPDETGFLLVHDIEINTCISKLSATKTNFIRFFCVKILCQRLLEIPDEKENIGRKYSCTM